MSYNRPKLSPCVTWNPNAITVADSSTLGLTSTGLFVDQNNTMYATSFSLHSVLVWPEGSTSPTKSIFSDLSYSFSILVTTIGDVYADNGAYNLRVNYWGSNASNSTIAMYVDGTCAGLFLDSNDSLYCSLPHSHRVSKKLIENYDNTSVIVAGTGVNGSALDMLSSPFGIFVDVDSSLYVADSDNHRIQLFGPGEFNGTTVAGIGAPGTITLNGPKSVILDADGYLFISDQGNHRVVASGPNGFRCIAGCTETSGSTANQLLDPFTLGFDSYGNLYVTDCTNNRIQKFLPATNSCSKSF